MRKTLLIAGGIALVAGGFAYYLLSRQKTKLAETNTDEKHPGNASGEKMLRHALHKSKDRAAARS